MKLRNIILLFAVLVCSIKVQAQQVETYYLHDRVSNKDTIEYKRLIEYDSIEKLYHVRDYYPDGQIQMEGTYSSFDKRIKEKSFWCNYKGNTKEGEFKRWYKNGLLLSKNNYSKGLRDGLHEYWYLNGERESVQHYNKGQKHGKCTWWNEDGSLQREMTFVRGENQHKKDTNYHYISYTPKTYQADSLKKWPLIIYLHGGSSRGQDTIKLFSHGIPDQIWRGREFPFVIVAPQCPINQRWSTDDWFENFYQEITSKYRVDTDRIYLTGVSLGGSGTWYLAMKHPDKFAAIAPMSGFTRHMDFIENNIDRLIDMPIWAFHGKIDRIVEFEDTEWLVNELMRKDKNVKFTAEPNVGHWMDWHVYTNQEIYDWFLEHDMGKRDEN